MKETNRTQNAINVVVPFARLYNKCNKIRQQTDGVMGGTPLRDRRGGRLP